MPEHGRGACSATPGLLSLPAAVLRVITAVPGWPLLPVELAALMGPAWALQAAYHQGLPAQRLQAVAWQLVAAARACPRPWPVQAAGLQQAIADLHRFCSADCGEVDDPRGWGGAHAGEPKG
jgi:hypothetical protein